MLNLHPMCAMNDPKRAMERQRREDVRESARGQGCKDVTKYKALKRNGLDAAHQWVDICGKVRRIARSRRSTARVELFGYLDGLINGDANEPPR